MNRLSVLILLLGAFASLAAAASAPTFCKCTCFTNSTIIEIKPKSPKGGSSSNPPAQHGPPSGVGGSSHPGPEHNNGEDSEQDTLLGTAFDDAAAETAGLRLQRRRQRRTQGGNSSPSCSQCNRSFCMSQSLPICKGAADKDVSTMCFQRDSRKDQVIVWGFILGTAGLLGWAGVQKVVDARSRGGGGGIPGVSGGGSGGPPRGRREGGGAGGVLPLGRGALGSTGTDRGRGAYEAVGRHSRESSLQAS